MTILTYVSALRARARKRFNLKNIAGVAALALFFEIATGTSARTANDALAGYSSSESYRIDDAGRFKTLGPPMLLTNATGEFLVLHLRLLNRTRATKPFLYTTPLLIDGSHHRFQANIPGTIAYATEKAMRDGTAMATEVDLQPDLATPVDLVFDLPPSAGPVFELHIDPYDENEHPARFRL